MDETGKRRVKCPRCNKGLAVSARAAGKRVRCPACAEVIALPGANDVDASPAPAEPAAPLELDYFMRDVVGGTARCPACRTANHFKGVEYEKCLTEDVEVTCEACDTAYSLTRLYDEYLAYDASKSAGTCCACRRYGPGSEYEFWSGHNAGETTTVTERFNTRTVTTTTKYRSLKQHTAFICAVCARVYADRARRAEVFSCLVGYPSACLAVAAVALALVYFAFDNWAGGLAITAYCVAGLALLVLVAVVSEGLGLTRRPVRVHRAQMERYAIACARLHLKAPEGTTFWTNDTYPFHESEEDMIQMVKDFRQVQKEMRENERS